MYIYMNIYETEGERAEAVSMQVGYRFYGTKMSSSLVCLVCHND